MTWRTANRLFLAVGCAVIAVACSSEASNPESSSAGAGGGGGAGGSAAVVPRACRSGDPCSEGAECGWSYIETGATCTCDPSGHFFCDPHGGGGAPPWAPCTEDSATDGYGACELPATSCTETNGWCTRTCVCSGSCEMTCDGDAPAGPGVLCDASFCDDGPYGGCTFSDGDCSYEVACAAEGGPTLTGACP
jgi:hypothetical protein